MRKTTLDKAQSEFFLDITSKCGNACADALNSALIDISGYKFSATH